MSTGSSSSTSRERINSELTTVLTTILREASLLPTNYFLAVMQRALERGLGHKLSAAVQMEEFVAMFSTNHDDASRRYDPFEMLLEQCLETYLRLI